MQNEHPDLSIDSIPVHHLARDILGELPTCTSSCHEALRSFTASHRRLRQHFLPRIRRLKRVSEAPLCSVDGTHAVVETAGMTLVLLVAVAVRETTLVGKRTRVVALPPLNDADQLASDIRTRLEMALLAHQIRTDPTTLHVLDGSLIPIYYALRRLLQRHVSDQENQRQDWWSMVDDLLERRSLATDWITILNSQNVVAHSKHNSTNRDAVAADVALSTNLYSDAILWSLVLKQHEYTLPTRLPTKTVQLNDAFWSFTKAERHAIVSAYQTWDVLYAQLRTHARTSHALGNESALT